MADVICDIIGEPETAEVNASIASRKTVNIPYASSFCRAISYLIMLAISQTCARLLLERSILVPTIVRAKTGVVGSPFLTMAIAGVPVETTGVVFAKNSSLVI